MNLSLSGNPLDFLLAFWGGVLVSLTPCVFPLIPVTASYIGIRSEGVRWQTALLGFVYVTGMAVTYASLGVAASLTGSMFGRISMHPLTLVIVGAVVLLFGFAMFDWLQLPMPGINKLPVLRKGCYFSTFFLGLASGFLVAPCTTPVLGSILLYLASKKNVVYGASLLLCFAYGMGVILLLSGIFGSFISRLPKAGRWMVAIKKIYALVLCGIGVYIIVQGIRSWR